MNCQKSGWPPTLLTNRVFDYNFQIMVISLNQFTMCVFGKVIYLRVCKMEAGLPVVVEKVTRGHLKTSSKVISKHRGDYTKNFGQACVWYHWKGYLSGPWESDKWTLRCWKWWDWSPDVFEGH